MAWARAFLWFAMTGADPEAAYRFLSNHRVTEAEILAGHFQATRERFAAADATVLILHDTTEFSYHRTDVRAIMAFFTDLLSDWIGTGSHDTTWCAAFRCIPAWR